MLKFSALAITGALMIGAVLISARVFMAGSFSGTIYLDTPRMVSLEAVKFPENTAD
ncbi:MAG: hypothetical protein IPL04_12920 [Chitinophagaceae bacterium]|nr:hypothetical protein [Chitinophagaceae bacterium]